MKKSRKMALTGMLCALAVVIMMLGGVIPLAPSAVRRWRG